MPRGLSLRKWRPRSGCARPASPPRCSSWWVRSAIRRERRWPISHPKGSRFLINGEPTDNRLALASKGTLRAEIRAHGTMAHSAYPELGDSAVHKLVQALNRLLDLDLPVVEGVGPSTLNIGLIEGGRAPNVIADSAMAHVLVRLVGPSRGNP